ncbi:hypothetical protein ES705_44355 [subsurface metagenome]
MDKYIKIKEEEKNMKFRYAKNDFFGDDGWIKFSGFKVAIGGGW